MVPSLIPSALVRCCSAGLLGLGALLVGCDFTPKDAAWKTEAMTKPALLIVKQRGVDDWGIRWQADGDGAFLSFSDAKGDYRNSYLVDLKAGTWRQFPRQDQASLFFQEHHAEYPNGLTPEASGVVDAVLQGETGLPAQATFQGTSGEPVRKPWHHPGQTSAFTGTLELQEKSGARRILIRQSLKEVAPADLVNARVSVSPSLRYLVYIDGGLGGANRIYFFRLRS